MYRDCKNVVDIHCHVLYCGYECTGRGAWTVLVAFSEGWEGGGVGGRGGRCWGEGGGEDSRPVGIGLKSKNGVKNTENITELNYNFLGHTEIQVELKTVKLSKSIY